jgi:hypothetical protein
LVRTSRINILADPRIEQLFLGGGLEPTRRRNAVTAISELDAVASRNIKFVSHSDPGDAATAVSLRCIAASYVTPGPHDDTPTSTGQLKMAAGDLKFLKKQYLD